VAFPSTTFRYCKNLVTDFVNPTEQREIAAAEHNRANTGGQENAKQIHRADCGTKTFAALDCAATVSTTFCTRLQNTSCAQQLVSGTVAHCATRHGHLAPVIVGHCSNKQRDHECSGHKPIIAGTFLATYDDYVSLNGTRYVNHRGILRKKPAVST